MVVIKDFEMPSCCCECQMASCKGLSGQFYCDVTTYDVDMDDTERDADCPLVEAIPKAEYEARLKADMVAMLTEIQTEIREYHEIGCDEDCNNCCMVGCIEPGNVIKDLDIIQQKIDKLNESKNEV